MIIRTLYGLGLLEDGEFGEIAEGKVPAIARRLKRPQRIRDLSYIITCVCRVPMLFNSAEIQDALTTTIVKTKKPHHIFRAIRKTDEVFRADAIRAAFAKKLRLTRDPLGLLEEVIHTPHMMQCPDFQEAVALALRRFWKSRQNCLVAYKIDYDSWRYVFRDLLPPLTDYPELGRIENFQQALTYLLVQAEFPGAVLREAGKFDELLHTEVMTNAIEQLIDQQTDTYAIKRLSRDLPPTYQYKAKMKLEELKNEERRRQYSYDYFNPEGARPSPYDGYDDWYDF